MRFVMKRIETIQEKINTELQWTAHGTKDKALLGPCPSVGIRIFH